MGKTYCPGCLVPVDKRVFLPDSWKAGDPLPDNLTEHIDGKGRKFALQDVLPIRHYLN